MSSYRASPQRRPRGDHETGRTGALMFEKTTNRRRPGWGLIFVAGIKGTVKGG